MVVRGRPDSTTPQRGDAQRQRRHRRQRRHGLHDEDAAVHGGRAVRTGHRHAGQEEPRHVHAPRQQRPAQAGGEEAVVETLVGGEHARLLGLLARLAEHLQPDRPGPQEHLQHQETQVQERDEGDQDLRECGHGRGSVDRCLRAYGFRRWLLHRRGRFTTRHAGEGPDPGRARVRRRTLRRHPGEGRDDGPPRIRRCALCRHPREGGDPSCSRWSADGGGDAAERWIPAFAGMTAGAATRIGAPTYTRMGYDEHPHGIRRAHAWGMARTRMGSVEHAHGVRRASAWGATTTRTGYDGPSAWVARASGSSPYPCVALVIPHRGTRRTPSRYSSYPTEILVVPHPGTRRIPSNYSSYPTEALVVSHPGSRRTPSRHSSYPIQVLVVPRRGTRRTPPWCSPYPIGRVVRTRPHVRR